MLHKQWPAAFWAVICLEGRFNFDVALEKMGVNLDHISAIAQICNISFQLNVRQKIYLHQRLNSIWPFSFTKSAHNPLLHP